MNETSVSEAVVLAGEDGSPGEALKFGINCITYNSLDPRAERDFNTQEAMEAVHSAVLDPVHNAVLAEGHRVLSEDGARPQGLDWGEIAKGLLHSSTQIESLPEQHARLVSALLISEFSNVATRLDLVREIYARGLTSEAIEACRNMPILLSVPYTVESEGELKTYYRQYKTTDIAQVFSVPPRYLEKLLALYENPGSAQIIVPREAKPYKLQSAIANQAAQGVVDEETRQRAEEVSTSGKKVGGSIVDLFKIERFGLQLAFIRRQARQLFGTTREELMDSAFAKVLARRHSQPSSEVYTSQAKLSTTTANFRKDIEGTFTELSERIIAEFSLEGVDVTTRESLSNEQQTALRYHDVVELMCGFNAMSQYLDLTAYNERIKVEIADDPGPEVWSTSEDGAGVPAMVKNSLDAVIGAALDLREVTGVTLDSEHIYNEIQRNRSSLRAAAAYNISEIQSGSEENLIKSVTFELGADKKYHISILIDVPERGSLDVYAAITLGCPALGEMHPASRTKRGEEGYIDEEERLAYGSADYIDHALAVSFAEAQKRDMFELERCTPEKIINADGYVIRNPQYHDQELRAA